MMALALAPARVSENIQFFRPMAKGRIQRFSVTVDEIASECVNSNELSGSLSGTSMATPAVAGYLGGRVAAQMAAFSLNADQSWDDSRFAPSALIKDLMLNSPKYGGDSLIADVRKITDILPWNPLQLLNPSSFYTADSALKTQSKPVFFSIPATL
jgi:hypothetical protein